MTRQRKEADEVDELYRILSSIDEQHRMVQGLFAVSLDLMCIADPSTGTMIEVNPRWEAELGWTAEDLLSVPYTEFVHPDDVDSTAQATVSLRDEMVVASFTNRYRIKGGGWATLQWNAVPHEGMIYATARVVARSSA